MRRVLNPDQLDSNEANCYIFFILLIHFHIDYELTWKEDFIMLTAHEVLNVRLYDHARLSDRIRFTNMSIVSTYDPSSLVKTYQE